MSVNSKLTAIADAIRAKTGETGLLTLDDMAQDIAAIDTSENLDTVLARQETLIEDIKTALEGKAGTNGPSIETCTVEVIKTGGPVNIYQYSVVLYDPDTGIYSEYFHSDNIQTLADDEDDEGSGDSASTESFLTGIFSNVVCGTHLYLYIESLYADVNIQVSTMGGAVFVENLRCSSGHWIVCTAPDTVGAVATIYVSASY